MDLLSKLAESKAYLECKTGLRPTTGIILGSGLSSIAEAAEEKVRIPFSDIPHFLKSTVEGHRGEAIIGKIFGKPVFIMAGRIHFYEGHTLQDVTYPVRVMKHFGVENIIVTAAVGAVNRKFKAGDLMLITDHINMMGSNPLIGPEGARQGTRFPDMSSVYKKGLIDSAAAVARKLKINVRKGVYLANSGPSYETPAEVRMAGLLGADVVGMSTVPESIVANHCGMKVLGIAYISNMAAGILDQPLTHQEVIEAGRNVELKLSSLIKEIIKII
jgi:purine-nucleoside phosphorylase